MKPFPLRALKAWNDGRFAPHVSAFGGGGSTNTIQSADPWSGQQPYLQDIYNIAGSAYGQAVPGYYPSDTYAGLTPQQNSLMSNLIGQTANGGGAGIQAANQNVASTLSPGYTSQTQGTFNQGNNVLNNELSSSYLNPNNSPAYQTAIGNAMAAALPGASASFINGNRSDSGLAQAAQTSALANAAGGLAQQQYQANQGIQNSAAQQSANNLLTQQGNQIKSQIAAPIVQQGMTSDMAAALSTAGMSQTDLQNQINANVAAYNYGQMLPWNQLGLFESAVTGTGSPGGTTQASQPYYTNPAAQIASVVSAVAPIAMMALAPGITSDRRVKTDIQEVGETTSGYPLFLFRYKGEGPMSRHLGVMAQDVEKTRPEAVITLPSGLKMVDYAKALAT